jgi:hypothetical protein
MRLPCTRLAKGHNYLDKEDFNIGIWDLFHDLQQNDTMANHFSLFLPTIKALPKWMQRAMGMAFVMAFEETSIVLPKSWSSLISGYRNP